MSVLLIRLAGPMQSWGTQSRFQIRDTGLEPSRSGVTGLLCAALGRRRREPLDDFHQLKMAVRVDQEGEFRRDFHTAGGGQLATRPLTRSGQSYGVVKASGAKGDTVISQRDYLADANFLVALAGDSHFLELLQSALKSPVWPLCLGRKSFVPGVPVRIPDGLQDGDDPESALRVYPWEKPKRRPSDFTAEQQPIRLVVETDDPAEADAQPYDLPLSFMPRRFTVRHTCTRWISVEQLAQIASPYSEEDSCI